jgi:hypothetical protein
MDYLGIDEKQMAAAAKKAGIPYMGCDTPDWLAETIVEQRADINRLLEACYAVDDAWAGNGDMAAAVDACLLAIAKGGWGK